MIVPKALFSEVVKKLSQKGQYGLDTETTGLRRHDRLFSIILADDHEGYYFNFNDRPDHLGNLPPAEYILPRAWIEKLAPILENESSLFFLHNAKFDLGMLAKDGLSVLGSVHCTEAMERVLQNNILGHKPYSLKSCAKRRGFEKDDAVELYIKKHKLVTKIEIPGKDKKVELKHFDLVPFEIITPYGATDAIITRAIGLQQIAQVIQIENQAPSHAPKLQPLIENERRLTKVCFRMEDSGVHIDRAYTSQALAYTQEQIKLERAHFETLTGMEFQDSATVLKAVFEKFNINVPKTRTGQICTNKQVLDDLDHPIAEQIRKIRTKEKLCSTYYSSFLYFADDQDLVHANIRQGGTETSRLSYSDPNLQNLPKEDEEEDRAKPFIVRRCFTPINSDYCLVPIDFRQQEFRMMLDYAGEQGLIVPIMAGMDVHEATAQMLGITRKQAKTINFGLLYGMGAPKLAKALGVDLEQAHELRNLYFSRLPQVKALIKGVMNTGSKRGYVINWFGFRNHISSSEYAYVLPNHLIQGGCAQVIRIAMVRLQDYIVKHQLRSQMLCQVHDELLFQVHRTELDHVPEFQRIMQDVYKPKNGLYLECSVEHSWKSFAKFDQEKGLPTIRHVA